jgi:hypothetical protein
MAITKGSGTDDTEDKNYDPLDIDEELGLSGEDSDDDGLEDVEDDDDVADDDDDEDTAKTDDEESLEVLKKREEDGEDFR